MNADKIKKIGGKPYEINASHGFDKFFDAFSTLCCTGLIGVDRRSSAV